MRVIKNLEGKRFCRLIALEPTEKRLGSSIIWKCKCDCGNTVEVSSHHLLTGNTKSCGCYNKEKISLGYGEGAKNQLYSTYKSSARNRKLLFELSKEEFFSLIQQDCFYCREHPIQSTKFSYVNGNIFYNGVDRVDNTKGYILSNVVPCCKECNYKKGRVTINIAKKMIDFIQQK